MFSLTDLRCNFSSKRLAILFDNVDDDDDDGGGGGGIGGDCGGGCLGVL